MIRSRRTAASPLEVTISPPFGEPANAVTAASMRARSPISIGTNSTPNDSATDWIAANWPTPADMAESRSTAARVTRRRLLEQLQPFSAQAEFGRGEPGRVAAWSREARDEAGADRIRRLREHDRHARARLLQRSHDRAAGGQDDIRRESEQFRRVAAGEVGDAGTPAINRCAGCAPRASPVPETTPETPSGGLARPDRPRQGPSARRCAAPAPAAAHAP